MTAVQSRLKTLELHMAPALLLCKCFYRVCMNTISEAFPVHTDIHVPKARARRSWTDGPFGKSSEKHTAG